MNDIIINKVQSIQRCIKRAREELTAAGNEFRNNHSRQDAAVLNVTRACEQSIDLANYLIKRGKMGVPTSSGESFTLLAAEKLIPLELADRLKRMVGFRNIAVHEYQQPNIDIVIDVIEHRLNDLLTLTDAAMASVDSAYL